MTIIKPLYYCRTFRTVEHLYLAGIFIGGKYTISNKCAYKYAAIRIVKYQLLNGRMFQRIGNHILIRATIIGKPMGSIFFPLKLAPIRTDNNFKGVYIEKPSKLIYANREAL